MTINKLCLQIQYVNWYSLIAVRRRKIKTFYLCLLYRWTRRNTQVSEISATVSKEGRDGGRAHLQQNDGEAARRRPRRAHTAGWPPLPPAAVEASGRRRPGKALTGRLMRGGGRCWAVRSDDWTGWWKYKIAWKQTSSKILENNGVGLLGCTLCGTIT
jgi:hypothetical protein